MAEGNGETETIRQFVEAMRASGLTDEQVETLTGMKQPTFWRYRTAVDAGAQAIPTSPDNLQIMVRYLAGPANVVAQLLADVEISLAEATRKLKAARAGAASIIAGGATSSDSSQTRPDGIGGLRAPSDHRKSLEDAAEVERSVGRGEAAQPKSSKAKKAQAGGKRRS